MAQITFTDKQSYFTSPFADIFKLTADNVNEIKASVNALYESISANGQEIIVQSESDLPEVVNGYHQIPANAVLNFKVQSLTLTNGLEFLGIGMIKGSSSETTFLNANIENQSFIKSSFSLPIQNISFTVNGTGASIFELDGDGVNNAHDWYFTNTFGNASLGTIGTVSNFVVFSCAFFNTGAGFNFTGTIATISIGQCLFSGQTTYCLKVSSTAVITRRFRINTSSLVATGNHTAIDFSTSASVPVESYILLFCNFAGGATNYITGVQYDDDKALFFLNKPIQNSSSIGNVYIKNNSTATVIDSQGQRKPIAGTSQVSTIIQRFSHDSVNNALQYTSSVERTFRVVMTGSLTSGQNNLIGIYLGVLRAGNAINADNDRISESEVYTTTSGNRPDTYAVQAFVNLGEDDKVYGIVQNLTNDTDITVNFMNLTVEATGN